MKCRPDGACPALCAVEGVSVGEASDKDNATEGVEAGSAIDQVAHRNVPGLHPSSIASSRHLSVAIAPLLSNDGHTDLVGGSQLLSRSKGGDKGELPGGGLAGALELLLGLDALLGSLQAFKDKSSLLPHVTKLRAGSLDGWLASHGDAHVLAHRGL